MALLGDDPRRGLNQAVVFTQPARPADPAAGTRAAPELSRHRRLAPSAAGEPPPSPFPRMTRIRASRWRCWPT